MTAALTPTSEKDGWSYEFCYSGNESGLGVRLIEFPVLTVPRTDKTEIFYPQMCGQIRRPKWADVKPGANVAVAAMNGIHFMAALNGTDESWYADQRGDARVRPNWSIVRNGKSPQTVTMLFRYAPPLTPANRIAGALPFGGTIRKFKGDWFAAAEIYRRWAWEQPWAKAAFARPQKEMRNIAIWFWNRGLIRDVVPPVERFAKETGLPVALDWYWWHEIPYDACYPFFWPPREGAEAFAATVRRLVAQGIFVQPYTNGISWDWAAEGWETDGCPDAIMREDGSIPEVRYNSYMPNNRLSEMCGCAPHFHRHMRGPHGAFAQDHMLCVDIVMYCLKLVCRVELAAPEDHLCNDTAVQRGVPLHDCHVMKVVVKERPFAPRYLVGDRGRRLLLLPAPLREELFKFLSASFFFHLLYKGFLLLGKPFPVFSSHAVQFLIGTLLVIFRNILAAAPGAGMDDQPQAAVLVTVKLRVVISASCGSYAPPEHVFGYTAVRLLETGKFPDIERVRKAVRKAAYALTGRDLFSDDAVKFWQVNTLLFQFCRKHPAPYVYPHQVRDHLVPYRHGGADHTSRAGMAVGHDPDAGALHARLVQQAYHLGYCCPVSRVRKYLRCIKFSFYLKHRLYLPLLCMPSGWGDSRVLNAA